MMDGAKKDLQRKQGAIRQKRKRAADKAKGEPISFIPGDAERAQIEQNRIFRGGLTGMTQEEYFLTLARKDTERIENEKSVMGVCEFCLEPYPKGCGRKWAGRRECYLSVEAKKHSLDPKNISW